MCRYKKDGRVGRLDGMDGIFDGIIVKLNDGLCVGAIAGTLELRFI